MGEGTILSVKIRLGEFLRYKPAGWRIINAPSLAKRSLPRYRVAPTYIKISLPPFEQQNTDKSLPRGVVLLV